MANKVLWPTAIHLKSRHLKTSDFQKSLRSYSHAGGPGFESLRAHHLLVKGNSKRPVTADCIYTRQLWLQSEKSLGYTRGQNPFVVEIPPAMNNRSAQLPVLWITLPVKTGNHHDPRLFREKEQAVRESVDSGTPPPFFHYRILKGSRCDSLDRIHDSRREPLSKFRANRFVARQRFFQLRSRFRQPDNGKRHCFLNRPALTRSHGTTSEEFCSYFATR